jgi:protein gp37
MEELGRRRRVFIQSMSDTFDNEIDPEWRVEALLGAQHAHNLDIQLLTKRITNVEKMVPSSWTKGDWPRHVGLMITVVNQQEADRDVPRLIMLKHKLNIPWIGLSCEPLLGSIEMREWLPFIDWVICGGESGPNARPMHLAWARMLRDQCAEADVPFLFKQWGNWRTPFLGESYDTALGRAGTPPAFIVSFDGTVHCFWNEIIRDSCVMIEVGKKRAGRHLDGRTHDEFPRNRA